MKARLLISAIFTLSFGCSNSNIANVVDDDPVNTLIFGQVYYGHTDLRLTGLNVQLFQNESLIKSISTDDSGKYRFTHLTIGTGFKLVITADSYTKYNSEIFQIGFNQEINIDINLFNNVQVEVPSNGSLVSINGGQPIAYEKETRQTIESFLDSPEGITFFTQSDTGDMLFVHFDEKDVGNFTSSGGTPDTLTNNVIVSFISSAGETYLAGNRVPNTSISARIDSSGNSETSEPLVGYLVAELSLFEPDSEEKISLQSQFSIPRQQ